MRASFPTPTWQGTSLDNPITKVVVPLIAVHDHVAHPSGTACIIAPWLAITARHVVEDQFEHFSGRQPAPDDTSIHQTLTYVNPGGGKPVLPLFVQRTWYLAAYDLAVLYLAPAEEVDLQYVWDRPLLSLLPPVEGSKLFSFGYPRSKVEWTEDDAATLNMNATTTTGEVLEVHHELRDRFRLPFPCFRTNARFDGGMSGAPVFNESGHVCGIVCSSLAPESEAQEHASYISSLWPLLAIPINAPWQRYAAGESFPLYEYAQAGVIDTIGLEHVTRERTVGGDKISCRYDLSNYRAPPSVDA